MVYQENRMHHYNMVKYYVSGVMQLLLEPKELSVLHKLLFQCNNFTEAVLVLCVFLKSLFLFFQQNIQIITEFRE